MQAALARPDPSFENNPGFELAASKDGLSQHTVQRLYKAASQGQLGKAWRQLRSPPPLPIGPAEWHAAAEKLFPRESTEGPPLREECAPDMWQPLKKGRAADSGGWTTEEEEEAQKEKKGKRKKTEEELQENERRRKKEREEENKKERKLEKSIRS